MFQGNSQVRMFIVLLIALGIFITGTQSQCGADGGMNFDAMAGKFRPCCAEHDNCYAQCGKTQLACDDAFYRCMKNKCGRDSTCLAKAAGFYQAVASQGRSAYMNAQSASGCRSKKMHLI